MNTFKGYSTSENLTQALHLCGPGRLLVVGGGATRLVMSLAVRGYDVHGVDEKQDLIHEAAALYPDRPGLGGIPDQSFDTVCVSGFQLLDDCAIADIFAECCRVTRRYTVVFVTTDRHRDRVWWEQKAFAAGFRRHPCLFSLVPYEALEDEAGAVVLLLEKLPGSSFARYPMETLLPERELHMDMLRESGRRADAHIARYSRFRHLVNVGDTVLDVACGLGYGGAVLWDATLAARVVGIDNSESAIQYACDTYAPYRAGLEYVKADAESIGFLEADSTDIVFSFETVEHVEDPHAFLSEVQRVLKPNGRIVCSVPNLWVDESGKDIGSYHLHSFGYHQIMTLCRTYFDVEQVFAQNAGGGYKFSEHRRSMRELDPLGNHSALDAEWWILVGRKPVPVGQENGAEHSLSGNNHKADLLSSLRKHLKPFFSILDRPVRKCQK